MTTAVPSSAGVSAKPRESVRLAGTLPFLIAASVYSLLTALIVAQSCRLTGGHFIYALDDTYINMAIAKNFALHGVWGITPFEFSSASSSPLYVILMSFVYRLIGVREYAPLALSWLFGFASIYVASRILSTRLSQLWQSVVLVAVVLFAPMFVIGTLGMEHSLHTLLVLLFIKLFDDQDRSPWWIGVVTALMVGTRYEGLFMAGVGVLLLIFIRQWTKSVAVAVGSVIPVAVYAAFSLRHGGYWLPNSIALKGLQVNGLGLAARIANLTLAVARHSVFAPHFPLLLAGLGVCALALLKRASRIAAVPTLVFASGCLHLMLADVGWVFRYEAYMIVAIIVAVACAVPTLLLVNRAAAVVAFCILFCSGGFLIARSITAEQALPKYSEAIYLQQWQTAAFLGTFYPQGSVAANDIGVINFWNDIHCLDLVGLASSEVFSAKRSGTYSTPYLASLASEHQVRVAAVYDSWFSDHSPEPLHGPALPASWVRVGTWKVQETRQLGGDTVSFYATSPDEADRLRANLLHFHAKLPAQVQAEP